MDIKELSYLLYKVDWMRRISTDRVLSCIKSYYDNCKEFNDFSSSIEDVIEEFGFDGELYVCFEEFLEYEYLDKRYMRSLLNDKEYSEYEESLKKI